MFDDTATDCLLNVTRCVCLCDDFSRSPQSLRNKNDVWWERREKIVHVEPLPSFVRFHNSASCRDRRRGQGPKKRSSTSAREWQDIRKNLRFDSYLALLINSLMWPGYVFFYYFCRLLFVALCFTPARSITLLYLSICLYIHIHYINIFFCYCAEEVNVWQTERKSTKDKALTRKNLLGTIQCLMTKIHPLMYCDKITLKIIIIPVFAHQFLFNNNHMIKTIYMYICISEFIIIYTLILIYMTFYWL